jgi:hypothetical protein
VLFTGTVVSTNQTITTSGVRYSVTRTLPATFGALSLEFASGTTGAAGDGFTITGVQIDKGSVALPFRRAGGTISGELAACQRYYYRDFPAATNIALANGYAYSTTAARGVLKFPVTMRTRPSALEQSGTATDYEAQIAGGTLVAGSAVPAYVTASTDEGYFSFTFASGLTAGQGLALRTASANGYLGWSAEL